MRMNHVVRAAAALLPLAAASPLRAQEPRDTVQIEELVVTAARVPLPPAAVPAGVTVISGEALRARGITQVSEALRAVPGISVVQTGSTGGLTSLFLRGGESDYVQVLVDGVPVNEPGGRIDLAYLSADNIERIEVVRGPASVLYGSDAVTGVIQIFTREGAGAPRLGVGVRAGTYGTLAYDAQLTGGAGIAGYAIGASRTTSDGVYDFNNRFANGTLSGRLRLQADARSDATLTVRYQDGRFHYPTDYAGRVEDRNAFGYEERLVVGLDAGRFLTDRVEARVQLSGTTLTYGSDDRQDDASDTAGTYASSFENDVERRLADLRLNYHPAEGTVLTAGVEVEAQDERAGWRSVDAAWGESEGSYEGERANRGYYAQVVAALAGRISLTGGARIDDNERFGTFETYRVGASYRLPAGTRLRVAYGTAFKEPTILETFGSASITENRALRPERSRSWEAGLEQSLLDGRLTLSGTYFDQRFHDLIQADWSTFPGKYHNTGEATAAGVELEARIAVPAGLGLSASYTWLRTEVIEPGPDTYREKGDRLLRRPEHSAAISADYRFAASAVATLGVRRVGERDDIDWTTFQPTTLPAYTVVELGGELELLSPGARRPGVTATLRVDNLFDQAYEEVFNFPARGRTILIGARVGLGL